MLKSNKFLFCSNNKGSDNELNYNIYNLLIIFSILETSEGVLQQTVKLQMKCQLMPHLIRICTICKSNLQGYKHIAILLF